MSVPTLFQIELARPRDGWGNETQTLILAPAQKKAKTDE